MLLKKFANSLAFAGLGFTALFFSVVPSQAQQASDPSVTQGSDSSDKDSSATAAQTDHQPPLPGIVEVQFGSAPYMPPSEGGGAFRSIGSASPLGEGGWLHVGPLYLQSAGFTQTYDRVSEDGVGSATRETSIFNANLVLDQYFRHMRLALQYQPQVAIVSGELQNQLSNQNINLDTSYDLSRRLSLVFSNHFTYYRTQNLFQDVSLQSDFGSGNVQQGNFLDSAATWTSDNVNMSVQYQLSGRTRLTFGPSFSYSSTQENSTSNIGRTFGGSVQVNHLLDARREVGVYYMAQKSMFAQQFGETMYHTLGVSYSQLIGASWRVGATLGASTATTPERPSALTAQGSFTVLKTLRQSSISVAYVRYVANSGHLTNGYSDRVDASYTRQLTRRLSVVSGAGDYREFWTTSKSSGQYGTSGITYQLLANLGWFVNWTYKTQTGALGEQIPSGSRNYAVSGLRWTPGGRR